MVLHGSKMADFDFLSPVRLPFRHTGSGGLEGGCF
jgi:hypothetical protein